MANEAAAKASGDGLSRLLVSFPAGSWIFREGEKGEEMYIIQAGSVEILRRYGPEEKRLAVLEEGDFFGEMGMLENRPRSASARVAADARLLPIDPSTFDQMLREYPEVAVRMLRALCQRLRKYEDEAVAANRVAQDVLAGAPRHEMGSIQPIATPEPAAVAPAATAAAPRPRIVHVASGTEFVLPYDREVVVGRLDPVTQLAPEIDLTQLDPQRSLSRRHARLAWRGAQFAVREEIGTANGTFVEGERLATGVERPLEHGTRLRFGLIDCVYYAS
jgi:CRP-like cAMP-binding protein